MVENRRFFTFYFSNGKFKLISRNFDKHKINICILFYIEIIKVLMKQQINYGNKEIKKKQKLDYNDKTTQN